MLKENIVHFISWKPKKKQEQNKNRTKRNEKKRQMNKQIKCVCVLALYWWYALSRKPSQTSPIPMLFFRQHDDAKIVYRKLNDIKWNEMKLYIWYRQPHFKMFAVCSVYALWSSSFIFQFLPISHLNHIILYLCTQINYLNIMYKNKVMHFVQCILFLNAAAIAFTLSISKWQNKIIIR